MFGTEGLAFNPVHGTHADSIDVKGLLDCH